MVILVPFQISSFDFDHLLVVLYIDFRALQNLLCILQLLHALFPVTLDLINSVHLRKDPEPFLRMHDGKLIHLLLIPDQIEQVRIYFIFVLQILFVGGEVILAVTGGIAGNSFPMLGIIT
ncbi:hypothetical protein D3C75_453140 [compost metagenome]